MLNRLYDQPLGRTGRLRRAALRRVLATHIASGRVELGDRRLRLDGYDIHLATGRVTREGEPVDLALPTGRRAVPLPFLPYDEVLLERVVHTVSHLLSNGPVSPPGGEWLSRIVDRSGVRGPLAGRRFGVAEPAAALK